MTDRRVVKRWAAIWLMAVVAGPLAAQDREADLRELQPGIDRAIDLGVEWLLGRQLRDGSWSTHHEEYPSGQTALTVYTLLKSGLGPRHPAVARGLAFLERHPPHKTYSAACQIMAFQATGKRAYKPRIAAILRDLLAWQEDGWGYPKVAVDLSNTQYAALGLRAASLAGLDVPSKNLKRMVARVLEHQERSQRLPLPDTDGDGYARSGEVAGFRYRLRSQGANPFSGSMTTAESRCS